MRPQTNPSGWTVLLPGSRRRPRLVSRFQPSTPTPRPRSLRASAAIGRRRPGRLLARSDIAEPMIVTATTEEPDLKRLVGGLTSAFTIAPVASRAFALATIQSCGVATDRIGAGRALGRLSASRLGTVTATEAIVHQDDRRPSNGATGAGRPLLLPDAGGAVRPANGDLTAPSRMEQSVEVAGGLSQLVPKGINCRARGTLLLPQATYVPNDDRGCPAATGLRAALSLVQATR